jgi:hypothetical protein
VGHSLASRRTLTLHACAARRLTALLLFDGLKATRLPRSLPFPTRCGEKNHFGPSSPHYRHSILILKKQLLQTMFPRPMTFLLLGATALWMLQPRRGFAADNFTRVCYHMNGEVAKNYVPCATTGNIHCCDKSHLCLSNGLCFDSTLGWTYRGGCTVNGWNTGNCPKLCPGSTFSFSVCQRFSISFSFHSLPGYVTLYLVFRFLQANLPRCFYCSPFGFCRFQP